MVATSSEMALIVTAKNRARGALQGVSKDLQAVERQTGKTGKAFGAMRKVGNAAFLGLGIAAAGFVIKGISDFLSFEDKMTQSLAIMGDAAQSWRGTMEEAAREVGRTTTFSAEQAAESFFFLASAGFDAEQSIAALPQVARFAQAGMFDMARATDLATDAQSALGLAVDDPVENLANLTRVTDVLVKANTLANASVEQFAEALTTKAGAALKVVNKDIEEGVAVLAAFADQGIKSSQAGTALNIVFRELQTKAIKNTEAFKKYNVEVFDSTGKMANMGDIISDLENALEGMSDEQKKATLATLGFNDKAVIFIQTLLGTSDKIKGYEEALRSAGGMTQEVADKQLESLKSQFILLGSQVSDVGLDLGGTLVPILLDLAQKVLPVIVEATKNFVAGVQEIIRFIGDLPGPVKIAIAVIGGLLAALTLMSAHPIFLAISAIAGIVAFIGKNARDAAAKVDVLKKSLETTGKLTFDNIQELFSEDDIRRLREADVTYVELIDAIELGGDAIDIVRDKVADTFQGVWGWDSNFYDGIMGDIEGLRQNWVESKDELALYNSEVEGHEEALAAAKQAIVDTRVEQFAMKDAIEEGASAIAGATTEMSGYSDEMDTATESTKGLIASMLELVDPVFGAISSFQRFKEMLVRIDEEGGRTNEELFELAQMTLEVGAQFEALDSTQIQAAINALSVALGISISDAEELLVELGLLDGLEIVNTVTTHFRETGGGRGGDGGGGGRRPRQERHGGPVRVGEPLFVGEAGVELFVPAASGTIVPNNELSTSNEGGNEVHLHLHDVDLSEGSRRVLEQIREGIRQLDLESL